MEDLVEPQLESNISIDERKQLADEATEQEGQENSFNTGLKHYRPSAADSNKLNDIIARLNIKKSDSFIR